MGEYRKLIVWQRAHALVLRVYALARQLPPEERFVLATQLSRAAVSVPSNFVEGCGRNSDIEFARYVRIALGSLTELEYLLSLTADLRPGTDSALITECEELRRMLAGLERRLRARGQRGASTARSFHAANVEESDDGPGA